MDVILLFIFGYQLYRMASLKGVSPRPYILNFVAAYLVLNFILVLFIMNIFGINFLQDPALVSKILIAAPFAILFQILLFIWMRRKIQRLPDNGTDDDSPPPTSPKPEKKDLSYFR